MVHDDVDVVLRDAAVMHQYHAAVAWYACDEPFGRRAVMQEIAGEADLPVPLPQRAAAGEKFGFGGRLHEMDRQRRVALGGDRPQGRILHRIERMGRQRGVRMAEQGPHGVGRRETQAEKFDESMVGDAAALLDGEGGIAVGDVADGLHSGLPHGGVGSSYGPQPLFGTEPLPDLPHGSGETRETASFGNRAAQVGEFEVAVGIDQSRRQNTGVEFGARHTVGFGTGPHGEDTAVRRNFDERVADESLRRPEQVRGYPPGWLRGRIHRRKYGCRAAACRGCPRRPRFRAYNRSSGR